MHILTVPYIIMVFGAKDIEGEKGKEALKSMSTVEETYQDFLCQMGEERFLGPYYKACEKIERELERINLEYSGKLGRKFISQVSCRIKTPESCLDKMIKKKYTVERGMAQERLGDIAGIRVICNFLDDVYMLAEIIEADSHFEIVKTKDYVRKPKASGYQSFHMIAMVPTDGGQKKKVEIQIRTQAMNLWAVVEHHFVYKKGIYGKAEYEKDFRECARTIYKLDKKMLLIRKKMETCQKNSSENT